MTKNSITQFVCFLTKIELDEFTGEWDRYAQKLISKKADPVLLQQAELNNRFRYISKHEWPEPDFHFNFINDRSSKHFPEQKVKIIQAGGYLPAQATKKAHVTESDSRVVAFLGHGENDIGFYKTLPGYHRLNIHQAYYESCTYGYVLEYFVPENSQSGLLTLLNQRPGVEAGSYRECLVTHAS